MKLKPMPLSQLAAVQSGGGAPQDANAFTATGFPFIRAGSLPKLLDGATEACLERIEPALAKQHGLNLFPAGTVLFAKSGMSATKGYIYRLRESAYVVSHLAALTPHNPDDSAFLVRLLERFPPTVLIKDPAYPSIRLGDIESMKVLAPSDPSERRRIAEILDKADALRAKRRAALAQLDTLTQSVFLDIFGENLDAPAVDTRTHRATVPSECSWVLLTDVARLATGHTPDREQPDYWNGEIPWISLTDIRSLDGTEAIGTLQNVTRLGIENSSSVLLPKGTVCFSRTASVGFVTVMGREMATSQDFMNWVCGPLLDPTYLMWALITSRQRLLALAPGSTHRTIYMRVVEQFRVLLPPIKSQREFSRRVSGINELKKSLHASLAEMGSLFVSLQHRAFRGEL